MKFELEVLNAGSGDCLIIHYGRDANIRRILIDGGFVKTYDKILSKRLKALRADNSDQPIEFELAMLSHIDGDHIGGLRALLRDIKKNDNGTGPNTPAIIKKFWSNSFTDLTGDVTTSSLNNVITAATGDAVDSNIISALKDSRSVSILASISDGDKLGRLARKLGLDGNPPFDGLIHSKRPPRSIGGMRFTCIGPNAERLDDLREKWRPDLPPLELAAMLDDSIPNLSSLSFLVKFENRTILLTGDARGDDLIAGLEERRLLNNDGTISVDILKVPHHGSSNNVDFGFFQKIKASKYVFSADGKHHNPDWQTLEMLRLARGDDSDYAIYFSNPMEMGDASSQSKFNEQCDLITKMDIPIITRKPDDLSIVIDLFDDHPQADETTDPITSSLDITPERSVKKSRFEQIEEDPMALRMAQNNAEMQENIRQATEHLENLILTLGNQQNERFIQNFPIRLNVWRRYLNDATKKTSLILTPNYLNPIEDSIKQLRSSFESDSRPGAIHERFKKEQDGNFRLMALPNSIHIRSNLEELFSKILPNTYWYRDSGIKMLHKLTRRFGLTGRPKDAENFTSLNTDQIVKILFRKDYVELVKPIIIWTIIERADEKYREDLNLESDSENLGRNKYIAAEIHRCDQIIRYTNIILNLYKELSMTGDLKAFEKFTKSGEIDGEEVHEFVDSLVQKLNQMAERALNQHSGFKARNAPVWAVNINRIGYTALEKSRKTVKADAAEQLFGRSHSKISWAIIDSGIDASHPAFRRDLSQPVSAKNSRITESYDFFRLLDLYMGRFENLLPPQEWEEIKSSSPGADDEALEIEVIKALRKGDISNEDDLLDYVKSVKRIIATGEPIDWEVIGPLLKIDHSSEKYYPPKNPHGTHVAGILAGNITKNALAPDMPEHAVIGICPDIKVFDIRVTDDEGESEEFLVQAALQFISHLNKNRNFPRVHGTNLSLSIHHEVKDYACGQTPICREANRLVGQGVVVVVAAGNQGYQRSRADLGLVKSYNSISITDPGNASEVITVGSTYRDKPHNYGVSYFSSRGPTGDGRKKPDLIAPGEGIYSTIPDNDFATMDGTSMAAPHVSGAAALIMARYPEFLGHPQKIKEILCNSATDIGREPDFQGAGVVDILRALQYI